MKRSNLSKVVGAGVVTVSMALLPLTMPASAQTNPDNTTTVDPATSGQDVVVENEDDGFDWGWLGLLGLAGLAGLAGRKNSEPTAYRDPDPASRTGSTGYRE